MQLVDELRDRIQQVLAVVEDEQHLAAPPYLRGDGAGVSGLDAEDLTDRTRDLVAAAEGASSTSQAPPSIPRAIPSTSSDTSRVLPSPPGPSTVTNGRSPTSMSSSASSTSRPTNPVTGARTFVRRDGEPFNGVSSPHTRHSSTGSATSFRS